MDAAETEALRQLGSREHWDFDELPEGIDLDMLRCLDSLSLIEARASYYANNMHQHEKDPTQPKHRLNHGEWYSPMRKPIIGGDWVRVAASHERGEWEHPHQIRLSDTGRAELARADRSQKQPPPTHDGDTPLALCDEDLTILAELGKRKRLVRGTELLGLSGMPKETMLRKRLSFMEDNKLVERPSGTHSGYQLTANGITLLRSEGL